jgi:(p)ppGpp synthase/HD superfamily hydrolase
MQQHLEKAISIALSAHKGEIDKGGSPYILHPLRVMLNMDTIEEKIVAILHDVVEDSAISIQNLKDEGYPEIILKAIELLTKDVNQSYEEYILDIRKNRLATKVKLADLKDNMNINRLMDPNDEDKARLKKYKAAYKVLKF